MAAAPPPEGVAPAQASRPIGYVRLGLWFGLVASLLELALLSFERFVLVWERIWTPVWVWMGPLCYLVGFGILGGLLALILRRHTAWTWRAGLLVLALAAAVSFLLNIKGVHPVAIALLAAGVATQVSARAGANPDRFARFVRRTWRPGVAISLLAALAAIVVPFTRERVMRARLPAAIVSAPNIVFVFLDTVRAMNLSLYGYPRPTSPELTDFAARGVTFDDAQSPSSWTLTSHLAGFSGLMPSEMAGLAELKFDDPFSTDHPMLAEVLARHGYTTAGFIANQYFTTREFGLDRGFVHYEDYPVSLGELILSTAPGRRVANNGRVRRMLGFDEIIARKRADRITDDFLDWQARQGGDRPWFAFLNFYDAHEPYQAPPEFVARFATRQPANGFFYEPFRVQRLQMSKLSPEETQAEMDMYDAALASQDAQLGRLFDELERRGSLDNTIVIVTADHGEEFMEHGRIAHVRNVYMPVMHVPLVVVAPGRVPAGRRVGQNVVLTDLPATVLDLAGVERPAAMPGSSLASYWNGGPTPPAQRIAGEVNPGPGNRKSLREGRFHFIRNPEEEPPELYDLVADPLEQVNLASLPVWSTLVPRYEALLDALLPPAGRRGAPPTAEADAH
jgi:arylsulfatase A-like enzyme